MARLPGVAGTGPVADLIRERRGGELRPLDELLLLSPPVAEGWSVLLRAIRGRLQLDERLRELVILRIAVLNEADYEWQAHEPHALRCGVTPAKIAAVRHRPGHQDTDRSRGSNGSNSSRDSHGFHNSTGSDDSHAFDSAERAVLAYTDAMTRDVTVVPDVYAAVAALLNPRELVELTATIATYNMVSRFLVALEISPADIAGPVNPVGPANPATPSAEAGQP
jgi:4-carboxymuconolactone decarboxylase